MLGDDLDARLDAVSDVAWESGLRVLQGHRLGTTDELHVGELLRLMAPPMGAVVADLGCGFGEVARLMRMARPDLAFVLVNRNAKQLARVSYDVGLSTVLADVHDLPLGDGFCDGAMLLYALCHLDAPRALAEAARIVRPGGFLFVFDYERLGGDDALMSRVLCARAHSNRTMQAWAREAGWRWAGQHSPSGDDATFRALFSDGAEYDAIFNHLRPVVWRFTRRGLS